MITICPKCGAYHADDSLEFCLADGTPLINVDPGTDSWSEGKRVIEEKGNALRKQQRKLRWRRVLMSMTTMMITIVVVCVVAVNGWIYLSPTPNGPQSPLPTAIANALPTPLPSPLEFPLTIPASSPSPSPSVSASPVLTLLASPSPLRSPTPFVYETPTPSPSISRPSPTIPAPPHSPTPPPPESPSPTPQCTEEDKSRESQSLINQFASQWERSIRAEEKKVIAENLPPDFPKGTESRATLGRIRYGVIFLKGCKPRSVTATYEWQISTNYNGKEKVVRVPKQKTCVRLVGAWVCLPLG